jgi:heme exporter protein D
MNWNSAAEFFAMGGYGLYVWGSFIVTFALVGAEAVGLVLRGRRARQAARRTESTHENGT